MVSRLSFDIIDTHDFKTLGIIDTSWYNPDITIEDTTIGILPPGYVNVAYPFFMPRSLNVYNSNSVGITKATCEDELLDLPDGLWKIRYSICPNDKLFIDRFFLRVDKIMCRYNQAFLNLDLSNCDNPVNISKKTKLDNIEFYITGAIGAANNQNPKLASDLYKKANKLLDRYLQDQGLCGC